MSKKAKFPEVKTIEDVSEYHPVYLVQLGKGKSKYNTRYSFSDWNRAALHYNALNIGNGYKKRIVRIHNRKRKVMTRLFS